MGAALGIPTTAIGQTENALVDVVGCTIRDVSRKPVGQ